MKNITLSAPETALEPVGVPARHRHFIDTNVLACSFEETAKDPGSGTERDK